MPLRVVFEKDHKGITYYDFMVNKIEITTLDSVKLPHDNESWNLKHAKAATGDYATTTGDSTQEKAVTLINQSPLQVGLGEPLNLVTALDGVKLPHDNNPWNLKHTKAVIWGDITLICDDVQEMKLKCLL